MEKTFIEINSFKEKNSFTKKSRKRRYKCLSKPLIILSIIVSIIILLIIYLKPVKIYENKNLKRKMDSYPEQDPDQYDDSYQDIFNNTYYGSNDNDEMSYGLYIAVLTILIFSIINIGIIFLRLSLDCHGCENCDAMNTAIIYASFIIFAYMILIFIVNDNMSFYIDLIITIYVIAFILLIALLVKKVVCFCGDISLEEFFTFFYALPFKSISITLFLPGCKYFDGPSPSYGSSSLGGGTTVVTFATTSGSGSIGSGSSGSGGGISSGDDCFFVMILLYYLFLISFTLFQLVSFVINICFYYIGLIMVSAVVCFLYFFYFIYKYCQEDKRYR